MPNHDTDASAVAAHGRLERIAIFAEIAGALAVVISVVYLAIQISDNNRLLRSQAHYNALEVTQRPFEMMVAEDDFAATLHDCDWRPLEVPEHEWQRCKNYYFMQVNGWEYVYYQHLDGATPPEFWPGVDGYFSDQLAKKPGYARFWRETAIGYGEPFRSYAATRLPAP